MGAALVVRARKFVHNFITRPPPRLLSLFQLHTPTPALPLAPALSVFHTKYSDSFRDLTQRASKLSHERSFCAVHSLTSLGSSSSSHPPLRGPLEERFRFRCCDCGVLTRFPFPKAEFCIRWKDAMPRRTVRPAVDTMSQSTDRCAWTNDATIGRQLLLE